MEIEKDLKNSLCLLGKTSGASSLKLITKLVVPFYADRILQSIRIPITYVSNEKIQKFFGTYLEVIKLFHAQLN